MKGNECQNGFGKNFPEVGRSKKSATETKHGRARYASVDANRSAIFFLSIGKKYERKLKLIEKF